MFDALVVTLREGVEAALIVGIALVYLSKIGRPDLRKTVYAALIAAFIASIAGAVALSYLPVTEDAFEGWVMLIAAVLVVGMIVFMMRTARKLRGEIESKVGSLAGGGSKWGLFAFVFLMVFREGVETVAILAGVSLNSTELMSFLGTLLGVALAVVFGVLFVKGSVRIDLRKFFRVTTVILLFVAAQLILSGLHELSETGVLPSSKREMALIGPIVRNEYFFPVTMLALVVLMVLLEYRRRAPQPLVVGASKAIGISKAEERKLQWTARREKLWANLMVVSAFVFIFMVTAEFIYAKSVTALSPAIEVSFDSSGHAVIPAGDLAQGDLRRYSADVDGVKVRFLLYRKPDNSVQALFDACQICGSVGFYKTSTGLVCKNCAAPINPQSVGQSGGCNPIPLHFSKQGDSVVINLADLRPQLAQFSH
ncbi:MAG TPA: Fe-S-containing protein [Candidatus Acidoferrales bacterium]|jgi:high-affinity iron transporter|nr:Fe-S-containing protein [Candidatus Acidoferrales bacterium]